MKKIILTLLTTLLVIFNAMSQDLELLDRDNGFLGIKFGQDLDSVRRIITPVALSGDEKEHTEIYKVVKKQYYQFGSAFFKEFTLSFFNNQLDAMFIDVTFENADILLKELESVYGPGAKPSPKNEIYIWHGKNVTMQYIIAGSKSSLKITSNMMQKKRDLWKAKQIEKAFDGY